MGGYHSMPGTVPSSSPLPSPTSSTSSTKAMYAPLPSPTHQTYGPSRATIETQANNTWPYPAANNNNNHNMPTPFPVPNKNNNNMPTPYPMANNNNNAMPILPPVFVPGIVIRAGVLAKPNLTQMIGVKLFYENVKVVHAAGVMGYDKAGQSMSVAKSSYKAAMGLLYYIENADGIYIDRSNIGFSKKIFVESVLKSKMSDIVAAASAFIKGYKPNGAKIFNFNVVQPVIDQPIQPSQQPII